MSEVRCLECAHIRLRRMTTDTDARKLAREGFAACGSGKHPPFVFMSVTYPRECDRFMRANDELIQDRKTWAEKKGMTCNSNS